MNKLLIAGAVILLAISFLIIRFPHTLINPGELSNGHQKFNNDCFVCHTPLQGVTNTKCIVCHQLDEIGFKDDSIDIRFSKKISFHKALTKQSCTACHLDHQGISTNQKLIFEHNLLEPATVQSCLDCHQKQEDVLHSVLSTACNNCHSFENWKTITRFDHDMINKDQSQNCINCHQKPKDKLHTGIIGNCLSCHSITKWKPATFEHSSYFVLDQDHNTDCIICHKNNNFETYTCYGCHEHTPSNIAAKHREEGINNFVNCVKCHKSADEDNNNNEGRSKEKDKGEDDD
ncbi:MAG: class III cytochrome C family protein [Saprospiraceae bacterium]|nr:class III cytochrome C family protein [Saprospiraceae bacterium]